MHIETKKQGLLLVAVAVILALVVFGIVSLSFQKGSQKATQTTNKSSKTSPTLPSPTPLEKYPISYDNQASQSFWAKVAKKPVLSESDTKAKNDLLVSSLGASSSGGTVYESTTVSVDYVKTLDIFQARITTQNLSGAKIETMAWFQSFGLSTQGICDLPLMFSIDLFIAQSLNGKNIVFNPLPEGCK